MLTRPSSLSTFHSPLSTRHGNLLLTLRTLIKLNVSQNEFSETEQRTIETEGNILAFRFLLERFANKQVADTRFQAVLTAFQTFGK